MIYVLLAFPEGTANVTALQPGKAVVVRYGDSGYRYVKNGTVEATVRIQEEATKG